MQFSIAIPTYEQQGFGGKMLYVLLNTIAHQKTTHEYEIVISDNSKNSNIKDIIGIFNDLPINYIVNHDTFGIGANTNNAIKHCKNEYIKPMFMDDTLLSDNSLHLFCEEVVKSNCKWIISNSIYIDANGSNRVEFPTRVMKQLSIHNTIGMPSCIMYEKSDDLTWDESLTTMADVDFYHQLYKKYGEPGIIQKGLIGQRYWKGSYSMNNPNNAIPELEILKKKHQEILV